MQEFNKKANNFLTCMQWYSWVKNGDPEIFLKGERVAPFHISTMTVT